MVRAQVCLIANASSGARHLRLVRVSKNALSEIEDQEAAYLDVTGQARSYVARASGAPPNRSARR